MKTVTILLLLAPFLSYPAPVAKQLRPAPEQSGAVAAARDEHDVSRPDSLHEVEMKALSYGWRRPSLL